MMYQMDDTLLRVINDLTEAVKVCYEVDESQMIMKRPTHLLLVTHALLMKSAIEDLNRIVSQLQKPMEDFYTYVLAFYGENGIYKIAELHETW
jgi:hypothetical protein